MGKWELKLLSLGEIQPVLKPVLSAGITEAQATSEPKKTGVNRRNCLACA